MESYFSQINKIINVSRETYEKLELFAEEIKKWNNHINLISKKNIDEIWHRHIIDSVQLINYVKQEDKTLIDFGSGGGLPAIIMAIINKFHKVHMVESDKRKCAFLNEFSTKIDANIEVHNNRIEEIDIIKSDIITARALAPLEKLFQLLEPFIFESNKVLFLKGELINQEIKQAQKNWQFEYNLHDSITNSNAKIIEITKINAINK